MLENIVEKLKKTVMWLTNSGLKINEGKAELCVFHRKDLSVSSINLHNLITIKEKKSMSVLGFVFDSKLPWDEQVTKPILGANKSLQALNIISKYFMQKEMVKLATAFL